MPAFQDFSLVFLIQSEPSYFTSVPSVFLYTPVPPTLISIYDISGLCMGQKCKLFFLKKTWKNHSSELLPLHIEKTTDF